jgi:anti-anti-sigma factor
MGSFSPLTIRSDVRNGIGRMSLRGELDVATVPAFVRQLASLARQAPSAIVLELRQVTSMDGAALRALVDARRRPPRTGRGSVIGLLIAGSNRSVRRTLQLTGTEFLMDEAGAAVLLDRFIAGPTLPPVPAGGGAASSEAAPLREGDATDFPERVTVLR